MHIDRKPEEQLEVNWAGQTTSVIDSNTCDVVNDYVYIEAFLSQNQERGITAHVNAYKFFGGVTRILITDNQKTGVQRVYWYTPAFLAKFK